MSWIELHNNLPEHRKTIRLKNALRLRGSQAVGHLCLLWLWAVEHTRDGRLEKLTPRDLARIADFPERRGAEFVDALLDAGFLDRDDSGLRIHDWEDYGGKLQKLREQKAEEMRRRRREKQRYRNVEATLPERSDIQYSTQQDTTGEDRTEQKKSLVVVGERAARTRM